MEEATSAGEHVTPSPQEAGDALIVSGAAGQPASSASLVSCDRHLDQQQPGLMLSEQHTALYYGSTTGQTEWDC